MLHHELSLFGYQCGREVSGVSDVCKPPAFTAALGTACSCWVSMPACHTCHWHLYGVLFPIWRDPKAGHTPHYNCPVTTFWGGCQFGKKVESQPLDRQSSQWQRPWMWGPWSPPDWGPHTQTACQISPVTRPFLWDYSSCPCHTGPVCAKATPVTHTASLKATCQHCWVVSTHILQ